MTNIKTKSDQVTNLDYLLTLSKGNTQFIQEMIGTFLEENPKEIEALKNAIENKNFESIRQSAHHMQSSIPFVGLNNIIEEEVYEIEKIAADRISLMKQPQFPDNMSSTQEIEIPETDQEAVKRIETLFVRVKEVCEKSHQELKNMNNYQLSPNN